MRAETHSTDLPGWAISYALHSCNPAVHLPISEQQSSCSSSPFTSLGSKDVWCFWDVSRHCWKSGSNSSMLLLQEAIQQVYMYTQFSWSVLASAQG